MAEAKQYVCNHCQHSIQAWSDGNPYYLDSSGRKHYAYHPDHERLALCIGNDSPHLCLACGHEPMVDSNHPTATCPKCNASQLVDVYHLDNQPCPYCQQGTFEADSDFCCIS